ncbi:MAG: GTP-binding protein [Burkholderiales bacterium]|nr:GTP-binding protein [Burkholderiales bacterium]
MNAPVHRPQLVDRGVLRFITAGSVDDGKSTLIGRLLHDARGVYVDQLDAVRRATRDRGGVDAAPDLSLLTDGLEAEREQGITIDVAYRYFASPVRKFIIADTPGHEQYTRNMVTAASTADAAVILIDATRVRDGELLAQTRRHSVIAHLLGIRHVVVAINKIDLVDFDAGVFDRIRDAYAALAAQIGLADVRYVPVSALAGDNVVARSARMPWYAGPTLLALLEDLPASRNDAALPLRFPVQLVIRAHGDTADDYRGYAGQVAAGVLRAGARVRVLPSGEIATVAAIDTHDGALPTASAGRSVTVRLDRDLDVSRGDVLVDADATVPLARRVEARVCWLDREPLDPRRRWWLRAGTRTVQARVERVVSRLDVRTLQTSTAVDQLGLNDIGRVVLTLQQPIVADAYDAIPATGAFVLIDATTHQTAAAGMIVAPFAADTEVA